MMKLTRRHFLSSVAALTGSLSISKIVSATDLDVSQGDAWKDESAWNDIRQFLFADQPIHDGPGIVTLNVPTRAPHGGDVSIGFLSSYPQNSKQYIEKQYLVIDRNPSPIAAEFTLSPHTTAQIKTRVRVNEYSYVRLIAKTNDGELYMSKKLVKAAGGCSAPPLGEASMTNLLTGGDSVTKLMMGKTQLTQTSPATEKIRQLHLAINHPSYSGLQKDPITTYFIPAHYIETIEITNKAGLKVLSVKGDISFSENPSFDFAYMPVDGDDTLSIKITDSRRKVYQSQWPLTIS